MKLDLVKCPDQGGVLNSGVSPKRGSTVYTTYFYGPCNHYMGDCPVCGWQPWTQLVSAHLILDGVVSVLYLFLESLYVRLEGGNDTVSLPDLLGQPLDLLLQRTDLVL